MYGSSRKEQLHSTKSLTPEIAEGYLGPHSKQV
jgi:hypothetical protein